MAIEFIVEDGTGKADATSYVTIAEYQQYWLNRGVDYSSTADATIQGYLNAATEYIDNGYNFIGESTNSDQALEWPRFGVIDRFGEAVEEDIIPQKIKDAVCYMAAQVVDGINQIDEGVNSVTYGKISKSYSTNGVKNYPAADKMLKRYIAAGNNLVRVN